MALANWRDLSVVLLVIEVFFLTLIPGVILYFCIRGMTWTLRKVREVGPQAQRIFRTVESHTKLGSEKVAAPFIAMGAASAQARAWRRTTVASIRSRSEL